MDSKDTEESTVPIIIIIIIIIINDLKWNVYIIYNYSPKGKWSEKSGGIYRDAKRRGIYPALWTNPEGDSCFSTYQISWIKIT